MTDNATTANKPQEFRGGEAGDTITSSASCGCLDADNLRGNGGNDTLVNAGPGLLNLFGDAGNDVERTTSATGQTRLFGGTGVDRVDYSAATTPVVAKIDTGAFDSGANGDDFLASDIEAISGGSAGDALTGSSAANVLAGYGGADTLNGMDGDDFMAGGAPGDGSTRADVFSGGNGSDTVTFSFINRTEGVNVSLDGIQNDGGLLSGGGGTAPATGGANSSNVMPDVERVNGTNSGDTISAASAPAGVTLVGNGGFDTLTGSNFNDFLDGGPDAANSLSCGGGTMDGYRISSVPAKPADCEIGI